MAIDPAKSLKELETPIIELEKRLNDLLEFSKRTGVNLDDKIRQLEDEIKFVVRGIYSKLTPWQRVQLARHPNRPETTDYIRLIFDDFIELKGDRYFADDPACACGLAKIGDLKLFLIGQRKGSTMEARLKYNFGSMHPEGYRKALRKMEIAEKFGLPVISFVNTPGAYPGIGAEERGQAWAIAENIFEMSDIKIPHLSIIIGEGGSGGALGICVADKLSILENAYLSVISPEGCAAILWKDSSKADLAANMLKLVPEELRKLGIIDDIIQEPAGGAHRNPSKMGEILKNYIVSTIKHLQSIPLDKLLERRWEKYRNIGKFIEEESAVAGLY
ncbi:MAG: acetyl-CoA carboxylase carboxyltransferase subunit alpha [Planctomycetes bacterium]|nr:acetyl-CoA carboxylase carboxyltransferase subunit alpha [Planctomycetota bacterium]